MRMFPLIFPVCSLVMAFLVTACEKFDTKDRTSSYIDFGTYRRYVAESTAFDYCGVEYTEADVLIADEGYSESSIAARWVSEREHYASSRDFFRNVKMLEEDIERLGGNEIESLADDILMVLRKQKDAVLSPNHKMSIFEFKRNVQRLLYSAQRSVSRRAQNKKNLIAMLKVLASAELLVLDVSKCDWICVDKDFLSRERLFAELLLLSCHVDIDNNGWCLDKSCLDEVLCRKLAIGSIRFIPLKNDWALVAVNKRADIGKIKIEDLFPQIEQPLLKIKGVNEVVCMTSTFSVERVAIFRNAHGRSGCKRGVCRGMIVECGSCIP